MTMAPALAPGEEPPLHDPEPSSIPESLHEIRESKDLLFQMVRRDLAAKHPATESQLFGDDGQLNRYVNVYLNDEDVRVLEGLETPVGDSDTIMILPAMAGGC